MSNMRIAVAGTGGLAILLAHHINEATSHSVILLSRSSKPQLTARGFQVVIVDYERAETLQFALRGISTVISTVTGPSQINLITTAIGEGIRRFAPAEFEGPQCQDPVENDIHRRYCIAARQYLAQHASRIESTTFVCGILYERFQPGGLASSNIATGLGRAAGLSGEGDYIVNCRTMSAQVPAYNEHGDSEVAICLTAARDVARFVTKALDLPKWPAELRMCGHRMLVKDLIILMQQILGQPFAPIKWHSPETLRAQLRIAENRADAALQTRIRAHLDTAEGRYDYAEANLNQLFPNVTTVDFRTWFAQKWAT